MKQSPDRRARVASLVVSGLVGLMAASCTSQPTILPSKDFDRPTDITFVCMGAFSPAAPDGGTDAGDDGGMSQELVVSGRPMRMCHPRNATDPTPGPQHRTFGFVPNSANGLLSVIDADSWKLVDLNETLAGFNQYPLGRIPTQIVASDDGCRLVTANHGSCDLSLVNPGALMQPTLSQQIPGLPATVPGGLAAIGTTVSPSYGGKLLRLLPQEVALIPQNTAALTGNEQLCPSAWTSQAVVTFPSCNLIALINLPSGELVDGVYVRRTSDGRVVPEPLAGRAPVCPVDCTVGLLPGEAAGQADGGASDATATDAGASSDASAAGDADIDVSADGGAIGTDAASTEAGPPAVVLKDAVHPGPVAIIPGGARAYVGLADAPFILALDLKMNQLIVPRMGGDKGVIELHTGAVGTTRLELSVDPYADKPTAPGYSGKFVTREGPLGHPDRQYLYAIARDGSLRVVHVGFDPETECETNVDPLALPNRDADLLRPCLPVDQYKAARRPEAQGPGIRFPAPPIDVAAVDVGTDRSETSVAGAHAWVLAANGGVYLVNIDPVERYIRYVEDSGDVKMCPPTELVPAACYVEPPPPPNTPRNRNFLSFTPTLPQFDGPARLDVQATQPQTGPRIESIWTRGTAQNATSDTTATPSAPYIETQVFFQQKDPTAPIPQPWSVSWEGALSGPRASGQILVDGATDTFAIQDPGLDYCRLGLMERDLVRLTGCTQDAECGMNNVCRHGTQGAVAAGGLPINGLCVKKDLPAERATVCDSLVSTVRRYEVTKATQSVLVLRPHMDELVRPDLDPCVVLGSSPGEAADGGADGGAAGDGSATDNGTDGGRPLNKCINPNDPSTNGFLCVALANPEKTAVEKRCLMHCEAAGSTSGCRSGRICVNFSKDPIPMGASDAEKANPCLLPDRCFCADGPDLANNGFQDTCFGELLAYQLHGGRSFVVSGGSTGIPTTREATPGNGQCRDIAGLDPRTVSRIPLNAPHCTNVADDTTLDSRCDPDDPTRCPAGAKLVTSSGLPAAKEFASNQAGALLTIAQKTSGDPNPCLFWGGPNETDPLSVSMAQHVHALFRNSSLQFMMTNLELPISGAYQIRFDVHGGFQTQIVYIPPSVEVGMPARIVLGPFDAQLPTAADQMMPDVPYLFVVDQRRLGRTTGGGPTRGQVLRIQPVGRAITVPTVGTQPWFEDFATSGNLFPIQ